jgi:hypothetical protein
MENCGGLEGEREFGEPGGIDPPTHVSGCRLIPSDSQKFVSRAFVIPPEVAFPTPLPSSIQHPLPPTLSRENIATTWKKGFDGIETAVRTSATFFHQTAAGKPFHEIPSFYASGHPLRRPRQVHADRMQASRCRSFG